MKKRTRGRELALKYLYGSELGLGDEVTDFDRFARDQETVEEVRQFAGALVTGVLENRAALRKRIEKNIENWTWKRLAVLDRVLLLIGAHEITDRADIPDTVTINEIVELAKRYGSQGSGRFVNGVLDALARKG
ncbi:MAG: transcription antitermination factor NusB [Planctomycetota bacterium]